MTMEELSKHMTDRFNAEMDDANNYYTMVETAEKMGHYDLVEGLCEMAEDECTHAEFIRETMIRMGIPISEESRKKWHDLEERMNRLFR